MSDRTQESANQFKIVAHSKDGSLLKGTIWNEIALDNDGAALPAVLPDHIEITGLDGTTRGLYLSDQKALFFVKSLEGARQYSEVKFFSGQPLAHGIWVRLNFHDNETIEGLVFNSLHFLLNPGFFMKPPDPHSNNRMMYVIKNSLRDFRIIGVHNTY